MTWGLLRAECRPAAWRVARGCLVALFVAAPISFGGAVASAAPARQATTAGARSAYFSTAPDYVVRFYPRFTTYFQQSLAGANRIAGPNRVGPPYGFVVSINVDTIYASFYLDLSQGPQIFTIPETGVSYSLLTLDVFGDAFNTNIQRQTPGTYGLVPTGFTGTLPPGVTEVQVPYPVTTWIIRADKYSSRGQNQVDEASAFRASLRLAPLKTYETDPSAGATTILPQAAFALRMKALADDAVLFHTIHFFRVAQAALRSPATAPLSSSDLRLSAAFNRLFAMANAAARRGNPGPVSQMINGARTAHTMIIGRWLSRVDRNHWTYFSNFADWGTAYLDRAAGNEYIQYGNNASTAGYYNAFADGSGAPLDGSVVPAYRLTFSKNHVPQANRFWSLTAYLPRGNTLVPNAARKYEVASFTGASSGTAMARSPSTCRPHRQRRRSDQTGCLCHERSSTCCCGFTARPATPRQDTMCRRRSDRRTRAESRGDAAHGLLQRLAGPATTLE